MNINPSEGKVISVEGTFPTSRRERVYLAIGRDSPERALVGDHFEYVRLTRKQVKQLRRALKDALTSEAWS